MKFTALRWIMLLPLLAVLLLGCGLNANQEENEKRGNPVLNRGGKRGPGLVGNILRKRDEAEIGNDLRQIAMFYIQYELERRRPPQKVADFLEYIKRDGSHLKKYIEDGEYILVPNGRTVQNHVIAYEKEHTHAGLRLVAMGDGSVQNLDDDQLRQALPPDNGN